MPSGRKSHLSPIDSFFRMLTEGETISPFIRIATAEIGRFFVLTELRRGPGLTRPDIVPLPIEETQPKQACSATLPI